MLKVHLSFILIYFFTLGGIHAQHRNSCNGELDDTQMNLLQNVLDYVETLNSTEACKHSRVQYLTSSEIVLRNINNSNQIKLSSSNILSLSCNRYLDDLTDSIKSSAFDLSSNSKESSSCDGSYDFDSNSKILNKLLKEATHFVFSSAVNVRSSPNSKNKSNVINKLPAFTPLILISSDGKWGLFQYYTSDGSAGEGWIFLRNVLSKETLR